LTTIAVADAPARGLHYDMVVLALGSVTRLFPVPGLVRHAVGFQTVSEAIYLHNQILSRIEAADATDDQAVRRRALTFVFVGAGYAGVEALAELEDLAR
jgi:NADH dehydrogenase